MYDMIVREYRTTTTTTKMMMMMMMSTVLAEVSASHRRQHPATPSDWSDLFQSVAQIFRRLLAFRSDGRLDSSVQINTSFGLFVKGFTNMQISIMSDVYSATDYCHITAICSYAIHFRYKFLHFVRLYNDSFTCNVSHEFLLQYTYRPTSDRMMFNQSINIRLLRHDKVQANNVKHEKYE